jgi:hypothetical protein
MSFGSINALVASTGHASTVPVGVNREIGTIPPMLVVRHLILPQMSTRIAYREIDAV